MQFENLAVGSRIFWKTLKLSRKVSKIELIPTERKEMLLVAHPMSLLSQYFFQK
jgi:hypothetical protein